MCRKLNLLLFAAICLSITSYAIGQDSTAPADQNAGTTQAPANTSQVAGTIDKIDVKNNVIRIKDANSKKQEIYTAESTKVLDQDKPLSLDKLKSGDRVVMDVDNTNTAVRVLLQPAQNPPPKN